MNIWISKIYYEQLIVEFKEPGLSTFNQDPDWLKFLFILPQREPLYYDIVPKMTKKKKNCDETNQQRPFYCVHRYIASQLNCDYPWLNKHSIKSKKQCKEIEELYEYLNIYREVLSGRRDHELAKFGCLQKNCVERYFDPKKALEYDTEYLKETPHAELFLRPNKTAFTFTMLSKQVHVYRVHLKSHRLMRIGSFLSASIALLAF